MNWKLRLLAAALVLPLATFAQTAPATQSSDQASAANADTRNDNRGEHHDYGWIGLLGLAGLAGLRRKHTGEVREIDSPRRAA